MARRKTHLTLSDLTLGYLRYLKEDNIVETNYEIIDILVDAFMENYAEENNLSIKQVRADSLELQKLSLRPQTGRSKEENKKSALKAMAKINIGKNGVRNTRSVLDEVDDDFMENFNFGDDENE